MMAGSQRIVGCCAEQNPPLRSADVPPRDGDALLFLAWLAIRYVQP
jgi:hypothetical protein